MSKLAFINGILLDGTAEMEPTEGKVILVEDQKITGILDGECPGGYEIIDLKGQYIMPGLINLHVHLPANGNPKSGKGDAKKKVKLLTKTFLTRKIIKEVTASAAKTMMLSGVTTIRTMGGVRKYDSIVRDEINAGKRQGPRILAGNMGISVPGGHMAGSLAHEPLNEAQAKIYVRIVATEEVDVVKLMITGGVLDAKVKGEPGEVKMPPEYVKTCCDMAHAYHLPVAAHVESPEGVRIALENGVDTIEHGAKADEEIINLFKERGAALVTTLSPAVPYALLDQQVSGITDTERFNANVVFEGVIDCAKKCLANGIPVGLGTDTGCPYTTHYDTWRELVYFVKYCDVTPKFALYSATLGNAKIAHIDDVTGSIEVGKDADFVVTAENPLENLHTLRTVKMVVSRGKVYNDPKIKRMEEVDREIDKFL